MEVLNSDVDPIGLLRADREFTAGDVALCRCVVVDVDPLDCGEANTDGTV